jgi:hypothetical protein
MQYLPPYNILRRDLMASSAELTEEQVIVILPIILRMVPVDEQWYCANYPDAGEAVASGRFRSAKHHFITDGYMEGRVPFQHTVDEKWYINTYEDVAERVESGDMGSATQHYVDHGFAEGRLPFDLMGGVRGGH